MLWRTSWNRPLLCKFGPSVTPSIAPTAIATGTIDERRKIFRLLHTMAASRIPSLLYDRISRNSSAPIEPPYNDYVRHSAQSHFKFDQPSPSTTLQKHSLRNGRQTKCIAITEPVYLPIQSGNHFQVSTQPDPQRLQLQYCHRPPEWCHTPI